MKKNPKCDRDRIKEELKKNWKKIGRNPKCDRDRIKKEWKKNGKRVEKRLEKVQIEKGNKSPSRRGEK